MSNDPHNHKHAHKHINVTSHTRSVSLLLCMGMLAGVLIWAKLRLVTDIPRSAYADPREHQHPEDHPDDAQAGDADVGDHESGVVERREDDEDEDPAWGEGGRP